LKETIVLFGAGATGRTSLKYLRSQGIEPVCFADNDERKKQHLQVDGLPVFQPAICTGKFPDATWVACAISLPAATEIRNQLKAMGVKTKPLWEYLPVCHGLPPESVYPDLVNLSGDVETQNEWSGQVVFRRNPDYDRQRPPSDIKDIYFPDFIAHRDDEHFVDCGAADGDTVREFLARWKNWGHITAFEPDPSNFAKLLALSRISEYDNGGGIDCQGLALSDYDGATRFIATGDYSAHLSYDSSGIGSMTAVYKLDSIKLSTPPTYIKMDIEGAELEALWGARQILKEHKPVLAICAYHTSDHLWQIPLLIHAIQPDYKFFFRRYAEGAFELVWYAVPTERVK
jgi:FkbM family methyltransferase